MEKDAALIRRAWGCMLGQIAGDSLGSQVEFKDEAKVRELFPFGMEDLEGSALYRTLPGQPTDDSEMALTLARTLVRTGRFDAVEVREAYAAWLKSHPVDFAHAVFRALHGKVDVRSESNCALMRVSPLGIFGAKFMPDTVCACVDGREPDMEAAVRTEGAIKLADMAMEEASITSPHMLCRVASAAYVTALACGICGADRRSMWRAACAVAHRLDKDGRVLDCLHQAEKKKPEDFQQNMSHLLLTLQNGFWQLLHASDAGEGVRSTVMHGGDACANAAAAGALLGAALDIDSFPPQWVDAVLACRPCAEKHAAQPRPEAYWPQDFMILAEQLLG